MTEQQMKQLIKTMNKYYRNKDMNIYITGALEIQIKLMNIKFFITKQIIILVGQKDKEVRIENYFINNVFINDNVVKFEMEGGYAIQIEN